MTTVVYLLGHMFMLSIRIPYEMTIYDIMILSLEQYNVYIYMYACLNVIFIRNSNGSRSVPLCANEHC